MSKCKWSSDCRELCADCIARGVGISEFKEADPWHRIDVAAHHGVEFGFKVAVTLSRAAEHDGATGFVILEHTDHAGYLPTNQDCSVWMRQSLNRAVIEALRQWKDSYSTNPSSKASAESSSDTAPNPTR